MEWSPDSWEVNVKRPSEGPFVFTTVWDDSTSCVCSCVRFWICEAGWTCYLDFDEYTKFRFLDVFLSCFRPFQSSVVACKRDYINTSTNGCMEDIRLTLDNSICWDFLDETSFLICVEVEVKSMYC
jgi:hypothetical protein